MQNDSDGATASEPYRDPVVEHYKQFVDQTIIRENLKLTPDQRLRNLEAVMRDLEELRTAMGRAKARQRVAPVEDK